MRKVNKLWIIAVLLAVISFGWADKPAKAPPAPGEPGTRPVPVLRFDPAMPKDTLVCMAAPPPGWDNCSFRLSLPPGSEIHTSVL